MGKRYIYRVPLKFLAVDIVLISISLVLTLLMRVSWESVHSFIPALLKFLPAVIFVQVLFLTISENYRAIWRFFSAKDTIKLVKTIFFTSLIFIIINFFNFLNPVESIFEGNLPRSTFFIYPFVLTFLLLSSRLLVRMYYEHEALKLKSSTTIRTLIYGAGKNGRLLVQRFSTDPNSGYEIIGFIDDDKENHGKTIGGVRVFGGQEVLDRMVRAHNIQQVIVSMGSIPSDLLRELVTILRPFNIRPKLTHSLREYEKRNTIDLMREINFIDLLPRSSKNLDLSGMKELVKGKCVLITGGGGSIGSELCRQILQHQPSCLLILDHSEYNLYKIDSELRISAQDIDKVVPLLLDLREFEGLSSAMKKYQPEVVFHAAAYKHVHLVEANPYSAILNNILGTKNLIEASLAVDVKNFVLISSDKAVNPVGIMGATKRVCELMVTAAAVKSSRYYNSVRFGNVLGSSGSLIPHLLEQIREGGPITITHPDMTRYFMIIPEAISLVLKAATLSKPGDINVLKMGEPVKIVDLAKNLIQLNGQTENEIPIIFTGLRPGEKLFEELYIKGDELKTEHPDILTIPMGDAGHTWTRTEVDNLNQSVNQMITYAKGSNQEALFILTSLSKANYDMNKEVVKGLTSVSMDN
jgi:FlaA1/EpsC-like NDP-sugar epimerase